MTKYSRQRDSAAAKLLEKGVVVTVTTKGVSTYNPATGQAAATPTTQQVAVVKLPLTRAKDLFREELLQQARAYFLVAPVTTAGLPVSLSAAASFVFAGATYSVLSFTDVAPDGTPVLYRVLGA